MTEATATMLFHEYYTLWIGIYKEGAVRKVTMRKYHLTEQWLRRLIPDLRVCDMTRINYQKLFQYDMAEQKYGMSAE